MPRDPVEPSEMFVAVASQTTVQENVSVGECKHRLMSKPDGAMTVKESVKLRMKI